MEYVEGLVSVITPTYKRSDMLKRAIDSVLSQTYSDIELIIVNDNERNDEYSEKLYSLLEQYSDPRLKFLEQAKHINGAVARNFGIKNAQGEFIAFLDDDDWWEPNKIELQVEEFKKLDDRWGVVSCLKKYYKDGKFYRASLPYKDGNVFEGVITITKNITTGTAMIRHCALDEVGAFDEGLLRQQDVQLFSFLAKEYQFKLLKKHLHNIDISDNQNRPNADKIRKIKEAYFKSVTPLLEGNIKLKKRLLQHLEFSIGMTYFKQKDIKEFLKTVFPLIVAPKVVLDEIAVYIGNSFEIIFKDRILGKYK